MKTHTHQAGVTTTMLKRAMAKCMDKNREATILAPSTANCGYMAAIIERIAEEQGLDVQRVAPGTFIMPNGKRLCLYSAGTAVSRFMGRIHDVSVDHAVWDNCPYSTGDNAHEIQEHATMRTQALGEDK
jgi:hypothetical protein